MVDLNRPNHLRLAGKPLRAPKEFARPQVELTPEQRARLASAIQNLRRLYGTYDHVAAALGLSVAAISRVLYLGRGGSVNMVARAAHLGGVPVETILYGTIVD